MVILIKKEKSVKHITYTSKSLEQVLNEKYNWCAPHARRVFEKQNANLFRIISTLLQKPSYELCGYDLALMLQEAQLQEESFLLPLFRDMKQRLSEHDYLFNYIFRYEEDHSMHLYSDLFINQEYDSHSLLMIGAHKNFVKMTRFLMTFPYINTHVETYNQYTKSYANVYMYALRNQNTDLLHKLLIVDSEAFWKYSRETPESLYEKVENKSLPIIDTLVGAHSDLFHKNSIYMELAMNLNQKGICMMIDEGEINPFYIEKGSGNSALISAVFTKNMLLFDKLMDLAPLWYILHQNCEGKSALDYMNPKSKSACVQHMYQRLHTTIKIAMEKPKVIMIHGKNTIYMNPQEPVATL